MTRKALHTALRPRSYVGVRGRDAASHLQRLLSNDVEALGPGETCEALLLTPKARIVAPLVVLRRGHEDFLLLTEPGLGERLRAELLRARLAARVDVELEEHASTLVLGAGAPPGAIPSADYGIPAHELLDEPPPGDAVAIGETALELLRIRARAPRWGAELDDRVMPAEVGLEERAISFTKGCYPGQEPVARLHYRGHANRTLRVLELDGDVPPPSDTEVALDGKTVGRVTSAVADPAGGVAALAFVRREVPADAILAVGGRAARQTVDK